MTTDQIRHEVRLIVATVTERDAAEITGAAHLIDDLGIDSTMGLEILFLIEEKFEIEIYAEEFVGIDNLDQIVTFIEQRLSETGDA